MIIDTHQHAFWHGRDGAALLADMNLHDIQSAWLLTWEIPKYPRYADAIKFAGVLNPARVRSDGSHPGILLDDLLEARKMDPKRFVVGYCPDPSKPNAVDLFDAACDMHDVRVCGEWKFRLPIDDPRSIELLRAAGRREAPVVLHLDAPYLPPSSNRYCPDWFGGTIDNLERALQLCTNTIFIGHAPGFWRYFSGDGECSQEIYPKGPLVPGGKILKLLTTYPNLMVDLSAGSALVALKRDIKYSFDFLCEFSERVLFARDYYGRELLDFLESLQLPPKAKEKIFSGNALRLVGPTRPISKRPELAMS